MSIIVTGLPRSGTSMMMRMLKEGGIPILTDNKRQPDEHNPYGYFELEKVKYDLSWVSEAEGKAVKLVTMLLKKLPSDNEFYVIFMERNISEIVKSQKEMLEKNGKKMKYPEEELEKIYLSHLKEIKQWISEKDNFKVLYVSYNEAIENPKKIALKIKEFLRKDMNIERMIKAVDKKLYRKKAKEKDIEEQQVKREDEEKIKEQLEALGYL